MTAEQTALGESVRRLLARTAPTSALVGSDDLDVLRRRVDIALDDEIGLAALLVPEEQGGLGGDLLDAVTVATEIGRACAPSSFVTSTALAGPLVAAATGAVPRGPACLVVPWSTGHASVPRPTVTLRDGRVDGEVRSVAGLVADHDDALLVVPALTDGELVLVTTSPSADGLGLTAVTSLDTTRPLTDVALDGVPAQVVSSGAEAAEALAAALDRACVVLAAEQVGLASWCLETTVAHLQQRRQFGRVLGSFQALKHRLATLWIEIDAASVAARAAADPADRAVLSAVAQSMCSEVAVHAAEECIQLLGGTGMTWEHPAHLYLKRAVVDLGALGSPEQHRRRLGDLVGLPATG